MKQRLDFQVGSLISREEENYNIEDPFETAFVDSLLVEPPTLDTSSAGPYATLAQLR